MRGGRGWTNQWPPQFQLPPDKIELEPESDRIVPSERVVGGICGNSANMWDSQEHAIGNKSDLTEYGELCHRLWRHFWDSVGKSAVAVWCGMAVVI